MCGCDCDVCVCVWRVDTSVYVMWCARVSSCVRACGERVVPVCV